MKSVLFWHHSNGQETRPAAIGTLIALSTLVLIGSMALIASKSPSAMTIEGQMIRQVKVSGSRDLLAYQGEAELHSVVTGPAHERCHLGADVVPGWASVQDRHEKLQEVWRNYKVQHRAALASPAEHRFLLYRPVHHTGHGNKMAAVATSLIVALVSNRSLIIDYGECSLKADCTSHWSNFFRQETEMDYTELVESSANQELTASLQVQNFTNDNEHKNYLSYTDHILDDLDARADKQWLWSDGEADWTGKFYQAHVGNPCSKRPSDEVSALEPFEGQPRAV